MSSEQDRFLGSPAVSRDENEFDIVEQHHDDDDDDSLNDLDDDNIGPIAPAATTSRDTRQLPGRTKSATSARYARKGYANASNTGFNPAEDLWQARKEATVDQSVNLMDAEMSTYEKPIMPRPGMLQQTRQKSLVDIFLSDDRGNSRGSVSYGVTDVGSDGSTSRWNARRCRKVLLFVAICLVLLAVLTSLPQFGTSSPFVSKEKNNNNEDEAPAANAEEEPVQENVDRESPTNMATTAIPEEIPPLGFANRLEALEFYIHDQGVSLDEDLDDENSSSYKAAMWISKEDPANLGIPGYDLNERRDPDEAEKELLQRYALACFYYSITGGITNSNVGRLLQDDATAEELKMRDRFDNGWLTADDVCYWHGVVCDADLVMVTEINLPSHFLQGSLPREIFIMGAVPSLESIILTDNRIRGPIPDTAAGRKQIQVMGTNAISRLKTLKLGENQITGDLINIMELVNLGT